jgi:hypothetical protein
MRAAADLLAQQAHLAPASASTKKALLQTAGDLEAEARALDALAFDLNQTLDAIRRGKKRAA